MSSAFRNADPRVTKKLSAENSTPTNARTARNSAAIWVDWIKLEGPITETAVPESRIVRVEPENTANVKNLEIIRRLEDTYKEKYYLEEGVDKAAEAAENQEIVAALRKKHSDYDSHPTLKYQKAGLPGAPDLATMGSDPINAVAALYSPYRRYYSYMKHYASSQRSRVPNFHGYSTL